MTVFNKQYEINKICIQIYLQVTTLNLSDRQPVESIFELGLKKTAVFQGKTTENKTKKSSKHKMFVILPYP